MSVSMNMNVSVHMYPNISRNVKNVNKKRVKLQNGDILNSLSIRLGYGSNYNNQACAVMVAILRTSYNIWDVTFDIYSSEIKNMSLFL